MTGERRFQTMRRLALPFLLGAAIAAGIGLLLWTRMDISADRLRSQLLEHPEFLADNPDIVAASRQVLQNRLLASQGAERSELIHDKWAPFLHVAFTPTLGQQDAPLVLIEFTDYTCAPCRTSAPAIREALSHNPDLRVAIMLLPTGGAIAEYAARIAFAAYKQNPAQFQQLHRQLLEGDAVLTQEGILAQAAAAGLDVEQLQREISVPENRSYLEQVRMFAADLRVTGVPAFALNEQLVLGGVTATTLGAMLQSARTAPSRDSLPRDGS